MTIRSFYRKYEVDRITTSKFFHVMMVSEDYKPKGSHQTLKDIPPDAIVATTGMAQLRKLRKPIADSNPAAWKMKRSVTAYHVRAKAMIAHAVMGKAIRYLIFRDGEHLVAIVELKLDAVVVPNGGDITILF